MKIGPCCCALLLLRATLLRAAAARNDDSDAGLQYRQAGGRPAAEAMLGGAERAPVALLLALVAMATIVPLQGGGGGGGTAPELELSAARLAFAPAVSTRARRAVQAVLPRVWSAEEEPAATTAVSAAVATATVELRLDSLLPREGFRIHAEPSGSVQLVASTDRGFILAAGRLRRELRIHSSGHGPVRLSLPFEVEVSRPAVAQHLQTRGVEFTTAFVGPNSSQPGSFSSWANAERFVKELAIFGGNEVELAHPIMGDVLNANVQNWSRLCERWDVDLSIWLPVDDSAASFTAADIRPYDELFGNCTRLDAIHVPGGDGGPGFFSETWWSAVRAVASVLRRHHPQAQVTVSANSFNSSSFTQFLAALARPETQQWLDGLQIGKEEPLPLAAFVARVAKIHKQPTPYYFLRVPDITHTVETGFPVPEWSYTWSSTHGREAINPAPLRYFQCATLNLLLLETCDYHDKLTRCLALIYFA